jgi:hypothetical protein
MPSGHDALLETTREDAIKICREYENVDGFKWWGHHALSWPADSPFPDDGLLLFERGFRDSILQIFVGEIGFEPPKSEYVTISYMNHLQVHNILKYEHYPIDFVGIEREEPYNYKMNVATVEQLDRELDEYFWRSKSKAEKSAVLGCEMESRWEALPLWMLQAAKVQGVLGSEDMADYFDESSHPYAHR